jgi:ribosomal protein L11 methyltransferase
VGGASQSPAVPPAVPPPATWQQLQFEVARDALPALEAVLELSGALVSWTEGLDDEPVLEPAPGETPLWARVRLTALFDPAVSAAAVQQAVAGLDPAVAATLATSIVTDRDWDADWRRQQKPLHYGGRLWVCPPGRPAPMADAVRVELEPGLAFGTGTHPTTALCLEWLAAAPPVGRTLLDYGCGSGILALAALALGASAATGVDIDPQALCATTDNAARNGVAARLTVLAPDDLAAGSRFDVVIANILSGPLAALAARLAAHAAPGARVGLSGILASQAAEVQAAWAPWVQLAPAAERDGWVLLTGLRQA